MLLVISRKQQAPVVRNYSYLSQQYPTYNLRVDEKSCAKRDQVLQQVPIAAGEVHS